jgi:O-antigen ligase
MRSNVAILKALSAPTYLDGMSAMSVLDIFTFEFLFMLFLYAGSFKRVHALQQVDVTLVSAGLGMLWSFFIVLRRGVSMNRPAIKYAVLHSLLVLWALIFYCLYGNGAYADVKIEKVAVLSSWAVIAPLLFINTDRKIQNLLRLVVAISLLAVVVGLVSSHAGNQITMWGEDNYQPLGRTCGLALLIVLGWGAFNGKLKFWLIHLPMCAGLFVTLMLAGARQAAVGLIAGGAALCLGIVIRFGWTRIVKAFVWGLACFALFVAVLQLSIFPRLENRLTQNRIANMASVGERHGWQPEKENRPKLWEASWKLFLKNPLTGAGIGSYYNFVKTEPWGDRWPHNLFLEWLCELGIVGFLLGIIMLSIPVLVWLKGCRTSIDGTIVALGSVVIFLLVCAMFSWDWADNRDLFTFGSLLLAALGDGR